MRAIAALRSRSARHFLVTARRRCVVVFSYGGRLEGVLFQAAMFDIVRGLCRGVATVVSQRPFVRSLMSSLQSEIQEIREYIEALRGERAELQQSPPPTVSGDRPSDIVRACRDRARLTLEQSAELKGIDDAIAALEVKLLDRQAAQLALGDSRENQQRAEIERGKIQAQRHAERINEIATDLAIEVRALRDIADRLSPLYWDLEGRPFITGFKRVTVPQVRSDRRVWTVVNRVI